MSRPPAGSPPWRPARRQGPPAHCRQCPSRSPTGREFGRPDPAGRALPDPWGRSAAISFFVFLGLTKAIGESDWRKVTGKKFRRVLARRTPLRQYFMGLFRGETGRQIFGDGVEFGVGGVGAVIGHLVDQVLPALGVQILMRGDFRRMAFGNDPDRYVLAGSFRHRLVIIGQNRAAHQATQNSYCKHTHDRLSFLPQPVPLTSWG